MGLDLQFISSGVAARSLQDALIWLSGLTPKETAWWGWEMRPVRLRLCPPPSKNFEFDFISVFALVAAPGYKGATIEVR